MAANDGSASKKEQNERYIAALKEERAGALKMGWDDRVKAIDEELGVKKAKAEKAKDSE